MVVSRRIGPTLSETCGNLGTGMYLSVDAVTWGSFRGALTSTLLYILEDLV